MLSRGPASQIGVGVRHRHQQSILQVRENAHVISAHGAEADDTETQAGQAAERNSHKHSTM